MTINWRVLLTVLLVALGLAATYNMLTRGKVNNTTTQVASGMPDYILKDFELIALDVNGAEAFSVRAPTLTRDERDRHLELETPAFKIPPSAEGGNATWDIVSKSAWVASDNSEIRLKGAVVADTHTSDGKPMKVTTEQLNVFPQKRVALAPVSATVNQPGIRIVGNAGLEAFMREQRVVFKQMRAHYNGR